MEQQNSVFRYTYSAQQQQEIKEIRKKYSPPQEDKMEQLRRLDAGAARPGTAAALALGILSTLALGIGMCCATVWQAYFVPGIFIGVLGIAGIAAAYPVYTAVTKRRRRAIAGQILALTDELLGSP